MSKTILSGHEARLAIKKGVDKGCDAVRPTLGAVGMTAMIEFRGLDPIECDDGVTILKNLDFKDAYENMGIQMLRKAAIRTSKEGGDGTATTTVLTQALVEEAFKLISEDSSKIREVRERLQSGLVEVVAELSKIKRDVTSDDIERIASISSLDEDVAKIIATIIKEVGIHGVVTVEQGAKLGYEAEVVKGARFDSGLISPYFMNDANLEAAVLEDVYLILVDRKINTNEQIIGLLNSIGTGKSILFIADDVDGVALATLAKNAYEGRASIACVKNPFKGTAARDFLFDMAALTGGTVISEEMGMKINEASSILCGRAEKVIVTRDTTTIIGGAGTEALQTRIKSIQDAIENAVSEYGKKLLEDRLASLTGGIGVIRVGAYTDTEFHAKKYKFENAINATQAALQEGILPGGGTALLKVSMKITEPMFKQAIVAPYMQMCDNAGMQAFKVLTVGDVESEGGVDFKEKQHVPSMFEAGIIDPFKVTRLALESAVAIASSLVGIETAIITDDEPTPNR